MIFKKIIPLLMCCLLLLSLSVVCNAKTVENEKVYKPLDLVVVVDSSGSMRSSDTNRTALDAVRMLVNMMPAKDSRVGIVSFNTDASVLTRDASGKNTLISLEDFTGVETIRSDVSTIVYSGGTGIGNAVKVATDLLDSKSDGEHTKAIILFTDGVNDFGYNKLALSECEENEVDAIKWAKTNDCYIYCVGYDYVTSSGESSMGAGGEGLQKLQNIADSTSGTCKAIHNISDIEQLLIDFLADVCDLNYKTIATIPGDGGFHECVIPVSPSVIEANIRIAGGGANAIKAGKIRLYDPSGKEIQLANSGNVRYDTDATAASIKVVLPKSGDWRLTVEGISGEDIHVGLLEHFKMNLTSQLIFPDGNPDGVAYTNDVIGIKTWLTYEDTALENDEIYEAVTSATAVCVSRANSDDKKTVALTRDGRSFVGNFVIPEDCFYDITIRLDWDTVYREDTLMVMSSNTPVKLVKNIDDVKVDKGKTVTLDNIYQYVHDEENDPIEVRLKSVTTTGVADVDFVGDKVDITGVKGWWAKTLVTLEYSDAQGNTVETSFKVNVGDPWAATMIIGGLLLIIVIVSLLLVFAFRSRIHLFGKMLVCEISEGTVDAAGNYTRNTSGFSYINPHTTSNVANLAQNGAPQKTGIFWGSPGGTPQGAGIFGGSPDGTPQGAGIFGGSPDGTPQGAGIFGGSPGGTPQGAGIFGGSPGGTPQGAGIFGGSPGGTPQGAGIFGGSPGGTPQGTEVFGSPQSGDLNNGSLFGGGNQTSESEISKQYNEAYNFGNRRLKKISLETILNGFLNSYSDYMNRHLQDRQSATTTELKQKLSNISVQTSKMVLHGTIGGRGGAILKVDKSLLKKNGITMIGPHLAGNSAELQYYKKGVVELDFVIITGSNGDANNGIRVRAELKRN